MNHMSDSFSLKKRVKGLLSLVLAIATIVAVFPPIDANATSSQEYYYFLTGFDGCELDVAYFVETDVDNLFNKITKLHNWNYQPLYLSEYNDLANLCINSGYSFSTLSSLAVSNGSATGTISLDNDSTFRILSYNSSGCDLYINIDGINIYSTDNVKSESLSLNSPFTVPAGNYQINYLVNNSGDVYTMNFTTYSGSTSGGNGFIAKMYQQIKDKANEIGLAAQGLNSDGSVNATKTVYYSAPSVNAEIIKALMKADGVSLVVTYNFAGFEFVSTITPEKAREMYREDITWYGPAYIAKFCSATWTGKTA